MLLAADQADVAREQLREAMSRWSNSRYLLQHWQALTWGGEIALYLGKGAQAYEAHERDARPLRRSLLLHVQFIRALQAFSRARCAVASIEAVPSMRKARIAEAKALSRALERERMPWTSVLAALVAGASANAEGDSAAATSALRAAAIRGEEADMGFYACMALYRLGPRVGGAEGNGMSERAFATMRAWGVVAPARLVGTILPGRWDDAR